MYGKLSITRLFWHLAIFGTVLPVLSYNFEIIGNCYIASELTHINGDVNLKGKTVRSNSLDIYSIKK